jgi:hypothetical protein
MSYCVGLAPAFCDQHGRQARQWQAFFAQLIRDSKDLSGFRDRSRLAAEGSRNIGNRLYQSSVVLSDRSVRQINVILKTNPDNVAVHQ